MLLVSCKKEVDPNESVASKLEGSWKVSSLLYDGTQLVVTSLSKVEVVFSEIEKNKGRYNTKTYVLNVLSSDLSGSFVVSDGGKKITLDEDGDKGPAVGVIDKSTDSELEVKYTDSEDKITIFVAEKK